MILSLVLSILIISGIFEIYLIAKNNYIIQNTLINFQENSEIINHILKQNIREAGYIGCGRLTRNFPFKNHLSFEINQNNKIINYHDSDVKPGTDAIRIWHANNRSAVLVKDMKNYSAMNVSSSIPIKADDNLIISDCKSAEAFQVKQVSRLMNGTQKITSKILLDKLYKKNSEINKLEIVSYYIGNKNSFFSKNIDGYQSEIAEGIDDMKIFFTKYPGNEISGVSFEFEFFGLSYFKLRKHEYLYVALS